MPLYKLQDKTCRRHWCLEVLTWSTRWPLICQFTLSREHRSVKTRYQVPEVMPKDRIRRGRFRRRPIPNRDGLVVVLLSRRQRRWLLARKSASPWYIRISRRIYHYYSLCRCVYIDVRSNGIAKQYMRMNSLFDPDQTGTGHQPYYFDQFAALYNRYTVLGSKANCRVQFAAQCDATAQPSGPAVIGVIGDDSASTTTTVSTLLESNSCKHTLLGSQHGGPNIKTLTLTYSPSRELGLSQTMIP